MPRHYLIVDLEATCCDQQSFPRDEMETIEIGAVILDSHTLDIVDEYNAFVKPVRHPQLTRFCTNLTRIQQADVDSAPEYPEVICAFKSWLQSYADYVFCSWGAYDQQQLQRDSLFHNMSFPVQADHLNLKMRFSEVQGFKRKRLLSMEKALGRCDLLLDGTHHRGIDDARNIAKLMPYIVGSLRVNQ